MILNCYLIKYIKLLLFCLILLMGVNVVVQAVEIQVSTIVPGGIGGAYKFTLSGYSSPHALISMTNASNNYQTTANDNGFFEFNNRSLPISAKETCLTAQDQFGRVSTPTCIPPLPNKYNPVIGPVLLPSTLSFDKKNYSVGDRIILSGQTIPNSEINISLFNDRKKSFINYILSLLYPQLNHAINFPSFQLKSDQKGNFSAILPSSQISTYRLFTQAQYASENTVKKESSPKSLTLRFTVLPAWMTPIENIFPIWQIIESRLFEAIMLIIIIIIALYFMYYFLHHNKIRAIILKEHFPIEKSSKIKIRNS